MKKLLQEFKEFALRGNVMDLAVGVIIGAAFQAIINSLVNDVISPLIGLFANTDLTYLSVMVGDVEIRYGAFLTAVINFIIMAVIIFLMVKGMNALAGLGKKKEPEKPAVKMCPYCRSKVAAEATRCPYCTSMLEVKRKRKETIECTLCDKTVQQSLCIQRPGRMQWMRSSPVFVWQDSILRFRLRNLYAVCIHIIGVLPDQLGDGNWLIALILQIVDQVRKRLCGINSSGMEQEDRAVLELATV